MISLTVISEYLTISYVFLLTHPIKWGSVENRGTEKLSVITTIVTKKKNHIIRIIISSLRITFNLCITNIFLSAPSGLAFDAIASKTLNTV